MTWTKQSFRSFWIQETSRPDLVVRVGESVSMKCRTNRPWDFCGWKQPNAGWCKRLLKASRFVTACDENPRVKYDVSDAYFLSLYVPGSTFFCLEKLISS